MRVTPQDHGLNVAISDTVDRLRRDRGMSLADMSAATAGELHRQRAHALVASKQWWTAYYLDVVASIFDVLPRYLLPGAKSSRSVTVLSDDEARLVEAYRARDAVVALGILARRVEPTSHE